MSLVFHQSRFSFRRVFECNAGLVRVSFGRLALSHLPASQHCLEEKLAITSRSLFDFEMIVHEMSLENQTDMICNCINLYVF